MKNSNTLLIIIGGLAALFFIAGGVLLYLGMANSSAADEDTAVAADTVDQPGVEETAIAAQVAQAVAATSTANAVLNPQPVPTEDTLVTENSNSSNDGPPPSPTSPATTEPTATPEATETPVPTDTPVPTNTPVPLPTSPPPTNTPPPPTNTSPPPGPVPGEGTRGLIADLAFQPERSSTSPNGKLWFGWTVHNTTGGDVSYNAIGILPRRNGVDYPQWFKFHYGGDNSVIKPEGKSWEAWAAVPEAGDYTFRLVVCFDGRDTCEAGNGTYHTLSNEIALKIN